MRLLRILALTVVLLLASLSGDLALPALDGWGWLESRGLLP